MAFLYVGATNHDYLRNVAKGGMTLDPYKRKAAYGTGAHRDDPFRFRFIAKLNAMGETLLKDVESMWLSTFERIASSDSDEEDLNRAATVEGIRFTSDAQFLSNLQTVLVRLGLSDLFVCAYTTNELINSLLIEYRAKNVPSAPVAPSHSGLDLRPYQLEDIRSTLHAFRTEGIRRGYWSIECGLGKTVMSFELIRSLGEIQCVFVVPRLTLLTQTAENFLRWKYPAAQLFVCGSAVLTGVLAGVRRVATPSELPATGPFICIATYNSLPLLKGLVVDMLLSDEAHHLVPSEKKTALTGNLFGLSDENIPARWRLAITASPKNTPLIDDGAVTHTGMSHQEELYGPCLAERNYVFGRDRGYLAPFEVVAMKTTAEKIRSVIASLKRALRLPEQTFEGFLRELVRWESGLPRNLTNTLTYESSSGSEDDEEEEEREPPLSDDTLLWYAVVAHLVVESVQRYNSTRIVTYHTTKRRANLFKRIMTAVWALCDLPPGDATCDTIHSGQSETENKRVKDAFKAGEGARIRILCNIRTLIEGFDEPTINTTVIVDNKFSPIDCKQIVGRGNRKDPANPYKCHRVLIPFLAYEIQEDETLTRIRSTGDYRVMRYTIKHIILSHDPNQAISQSVWVPRPRAAGDAVLPDGKEPGEVDPRERVWIPDETERLHDAALLSTCPTEELAKDSFYAARRWMHDVARVLGWGRFTSESQISHAWNQHRATHLLPTGIPHNPSAVYREVGWIHWRDYTGVFTKREEWQEIQPSELLDLIKAGRINIFNHTMSTLRTTVEMELTRKMPRDPKSKWKLSVYDLAERARAGSTTGVRSWGLHPDRLYDLLKAEGIMDAGDFERHWPLLHAKHRTLPGLPGELWNSAFWGGYDG